MKNLDVRFITNCNSMTEAKMIYVLLNGNQYVATVLFECFSSKCKIQDIADNSVKESDILAAVAKYKANEILSKNKIQENSSKPNFSELKCAKSNQ